MCKQSNLNSLRHTFACQGIYERRKTQYQLFLFFLLASGASAGFVLGREEPKNLVLLLLVPSLLQLPVFLMWLYQRIQIDQLDATRTEIDELPGWQDHPLSFVSEIVMTVIPLVFCGLAAYILREKDNAWASFGKPDFKILLIVALVTSMIAVIFLVWYIISLNGRKEKYAAVARAEHRDAQNGESAAAPSPPVS